MKQEWITYDNGHKVCYVGDRVHNDDGPAVIYIDGTKAWCKNGQYHREDGPAVEYPNGDKVWHYNGTCVGDSSFGYTQEKFEQWKRLKIFL